MSSIEEQDDDFFLSLLRPSALSIEEVLDDDYHCPSIWDMDGQQLVTPQRLLWQPKRGDPLPIRDQTGGQLPDTDLLQVVGSKHLQPRSAFGGRLLEHATEYQIQHNLPSITDIYTLAPQIDAFVMNLVTPLLSSAGDNDYIALSLHHKELDHPIHFAFCKKNNFTSQSFLDTVFKMTQSDASRFLLDGLLTVRASLLKQFPGNGRRLKMSSRAESFYGKKNDLVIIKNNDHRCGYLAYTYGVLYNRKNAGDLKMTRHRWNLLRQETSQLLAAHMDVLFGDADISTATPFDLTKATEIQRRWPEYQLIIMERPNPQKMIHSTPAPLFMGDPRPRKIILEYTEENGVGHYNFIKKLSGYLNKRIWCYECWASVTKEHICRDKCHDCRARHPRNEESTSSEIRQVCGDCNIQFKSAWCYLTHKENGVCGQFVRCSSCEVVYSTRDERGHVCDTFFCMKCRKTYESTPHYCCIQPLSVEKLKKEDSSNKVIVAFDIESRTILDSEGRHVHQPNLLISHTVCNDCYIRDSEITKNGRCKTCGELEMVFFGDNCVEHFCFYILEQLQRSLPKSVSRVLVFAHNFRGYDGRFIVTELVNKKYVNMSTIFNGTKIAKIDVGMVRFLDSISFFLLPLSALPKAFQFPYPIKKGCFPHKFNKPENYGYIGSYPDVASYEPDHMKAKQREEFISWYETTSEKTFNFMTEIVEYCRTDVKILLFAVQEFRRLFQEVTGIDPMCRSFTLASVAMETFRALHLKEDTIGIGPSEGYCCSRKGSMKATAWLDWLQMQHGIEIEREQRIGNCYVDGLHRETRTVFEFNGCWVHGCSKCFPDSSVMNTKLCKTMEELRQNTEARLCYLRKRQFMVQTCWEHDFDANQTLYLKQRLTELQAIEDRVKPLALRDGLCGGRTENYKILHECEPDEQLRYVDFTSLYPFVLKTKRFPLCHPQVITENLDCSRFKEIAFFGIVYCKILPPQDLFVPVLPIKQNDKLIFGLCNACIVTKNDAVCDHNEEQRALDFVWTSVEIDAALAAGYKLLKLYCIYHYRETSTELFKPYINLFLKIKQEKSGIPPDVIDGKMTLDEYIQQYSTREGIALEKDAIEVNSGLRLIAKIMLNSLWGKLVQRSNMEQTEIINDFQSLSALVNDEKKKIISCPIVNETTAFATWKYKNDIDAHQPNASPVVAMFVTAYARLELYNLIRQVESVRSQRICYADTDSLIFVEKESDPRVSLGNFLGDLTDEIEPGYRCVCGYFVAAKTYCLRCSNGVDFKDIIKCKGLSMNSASQSQVNKSTIAALAHEHALGLPGQRIQVKQMQFRVSSKADQTVYTHHFTKLFRVTSDKRVVRGFVTYPYGYIGNQ